MIEDALVSIGELSDEAAESNNKEIKTTNCSIPVSYIFNALILNYFVYLCFLFLNLIIYTYNNNYNISSIF